MTQQAKTQKKKISFGLLLGENNAVGHHYGGKQSAVTGERIKKRGKFPFQDDPSEYVRRWSEELLKKSR